MDNIFCDCPAWDTVDQTKFNIWDGDCIS